MEDGSRRIRSGEEYDHLFPPPSEKDTTVKKSADVEDTVSLIRRTVPKTLWHTEKIAKVLKGKNLRETCSNIWHFVYNHIQYRKDEDGVEQVRSPRRTWWERESGVDCDCYTEFISSILLNLNIPHKARITKYPKKPPEVPRWQHIYPIVPKDGRLDRDFTNRDDYIVIDCVKRNFDDEQPFIECKDYDMRLDYLDGIDEDETFADYDSADANDIASVNDDPEEIGNLFKKIGSAVKKGVRVLNRYTNPGTIMLRNGLLLAMKVNLFNVAGKLRYGYLSDAQAKAMGMNLDALKKVRKVVERAESIYYQAGGKKSNLKKAILKGKGNKNKKVPLNGLEGFDDDVYADYDEYNILNKDYNELAGLGVVAASSIAVATSAVAALGAALKSIKGLFAKGGTDEHAFQSETDNAGSESSITEAAANAKSEDQIADDAEPPSIPARSVSPPSTPSAPLTRSYATTTTQNNETQNTSDTASNTSAAESILPAASSFAPTSADVMVPQTQSSEIQPLQNKQEGLVQKTTSWVKANPGKSMLIAGAAVGGTFLILRSVFGGHRQANVGAVDGIPANGNNKTKHKRKRRRAKNKKQQKIRVIKL